MILGLGLVAFEMQFGLVFEQLGMSGRVALITCGTGFSVWGLKDLIAGLFPGWTSSSDSFHLPLEGWAFLVILITLFIGSLLGRSNMLMMVFASLIGPFVINGWFTFTMLRKLKVRRTLTKRVMAGETFTTTLTLENRKSWLTIWLMRAQDAVTLGAAVLHPEVLFVRIPAGTSRQGHYQLLLRKRGRYVFGPMTVTSRFPLGLVQRGIRLEARDELLVYPRTGTLLPNWRKLLQHSLELISDVRTQAGMFHDEMSRIREFRAGDDPRMIHWKTSARTNELMVREYEESRDRDLMLIVDGWATSSEAEDFERGLQFAVTACMDQLRGSRESSLRVILTGERYVDWRGDHGESRIENLLDAFAEAKCSVAASIDELMNGIEEHDGQKFRIVIVTCRPAQVRQALLHATDIVHADVQVCGARSDEMSSFFLAAE